jgi:HrpA-like RNA helicase
MKKKQLTDSQFGVLFDPTVNTIGINEIMPDIESSLLIGEPLLLVSAATGTGKTLGLTRLLARMDGICQVLMPIRISVKEMFNFVSLIDEDIQYGYRMRGESKGGPNDDCTLFTVGYWLEWFLMACQRRFNTPLIVVLDEAHHSSASTDFALRLLLWAQRKKNLPIQIIIASATLDITESIRSFEPKIFTLENKKANVDLVFTERAVLSLEKGKMSSELYQLMKQKLETIIKQTKKGDILVLLPGENEILQLRSEIEKNPLFDNCSLHDLYSSLTKEEQEEAINTDKNGFRKIIFATDMVENAITIKGLHFVVDSCLRKILVVDEQGISQLVLVL